MAVYYVEVWYNAVMSRARGWGRARGAHPRAGASWDLGFGFCVESCRCGLWISAREPDAVAERRPNEARGRVKFGGVDSVSDKVL